MPKFTNPDKIIFAVLISSIVLLMITRDPKITDNKVNYDTSTLAASSSQSQKPKIELVDNIPVLLGTSFESIKSKYPNIEAYNNGETQILDFKINKYNLVFESYDKNTASYVQITGKDNVCKDNNSLTSDVYKPMLLAYGFDQTKVENSKPTMRDNGSVDITNYELKTLININCSLITEPRQIRIAYFKLSN